MRCGSPASTTASRGTGGCSMVEPLVVITGASSGIGLALARAFSKEGHAVLLVARHMKAVTGLPAERTAYAEADVADYGALEGAIRGPKAGSARPPAWST